MGNASASDITSNTVSVWSLMLRDLILLLHELTSTECVVTTPNVWGSKGILEMSRELRAVVQMFVILISAGGM